MRSVIVRVIDAAALWTVEWLGSRAAFVQIMLVTVASVPLTVTAIDPHGFYFLYVATALSLVTQVPLAMIGQRAREEAIKAEEAASRMEEAQLQLLRNQSDTLAAMLELVRAANVMDEQNRETLRVLAGAGDQRRDLLQTVQATLDRVAAITDRDMILGERVEDMVERLQEAVAEIQAMAEKAEMTRAESATMIRQLVGRQRRIMDAALEAARDDEAEQR